nr:putative ribonuclease H-like domain-containing protein [Tanacetum cinerariifolium]
MDLFRPTFVQSLNKKNYCLVITDDYSRFTWVFFLATKDETSPTLKNFITGLENHLSLKVKVIRSDNGTEYKNFDLNQFCGIKGIKRGFSVPRTPQKNGIAGRKNRTLIEAARTMLADSLLPIPFWAEAVNTSCYVHNRVLVTKPQNKTPYKLLHGRTPSIGFMRPFGCLVTILNTLDTVGKFKRKVGEGFLVGYSVNSKAFRVFNSRTRIIQETMHVNFLENKPNVAGTGPTWLFYIDSLKRTMNYQPVIAGNQTNPSAGFQDTFDADKAGKEANLQYVFFPVWSTGEKDDITKKKDKRKSHVEYFSEYRDLNAVFVEFSEDSSNDVSAASPIVPTAGQNYSNNTNPISAASLIVHAAGHNYSNSTNPISAAVPLNSNSSPTHGQSLLRDTYQPPNMVEREDIVYSDHENVGAEADFNNLETSITHMTGTMSYLFDFQKLNGGYVAFGGNPKGGKISGKGKIKTDIKLPDENQVLLRVPRENNMYNINLKDIVPSGDLTCLFAKATVNESNLWHRRLGHINFKTTNKLVKGNHVRGLPIKVFENHNTCVACKKGKQHKASCKTKPVSSVKQPLFRLHMDLFRPTFVKSLNKKSYFLVITDDYSRFTWVFFLATKDETSPTLKNFITGLENQLSLKVKVIRSDNGTEFKNSDLNQFCGIKGIKREFSIPRTPQQNGIAERKNRTLIEAARTMLADSLLPIPFWAEAVNTACYVQNRVLVTKPHHKTPYELLHGRTPSIAFMRPFGCPVTILNTLDSLGKFEGKVDEGFLVGYSVNSKSFRVFNSRTRIIQETLHVNFLENKPNVAGTGPTWLFDIDSLTRTMNYQQVTARNQTNPSAGFQDTFDADKAGKEANLQYVLYPVWSTGDVAFNKKGHDAEKPESTVNLSPSSSALSGEKDDMTKKKDKGKSPVEYFSEHRDLNADFEDFYEASSNDVSAAGPIFPTTGQNYSNSTNPISDAGPIVPTAGQNYSNSTNPIIVVGPSNSISSPTHGKSSLQDASQMLERENIVYSDHENKDWILVDLPLGKRAIGTK